MTRGIIDWFARNSVAANLLMVLTMVGGLMTVSTLKQEVFPEFSLDLVSVQVSYLGAAPEEVEEGVCVRIEEAIQGLDGIKRITSTASEGVGTVMVELELGTETGRVLDDIKARIDAIDTFPEETEKPVIRESTNRQQVISVAIWGDAGERTLRYLGDQVRDEINAIPGITQVELANARPYEIAIEISEDDLRRHGLTFDYVAGAVRRASLDLPGGSVKTEGGEILLRTKGQAYRGTEYEDLVLMTRPDGTRLQLGEVARVVDGFAETDQFGRFDGKPAVLVDVFRTGNQSALEIAEQVNAYIAEAQPRLPEGITLTTWRDSAKILQDRLSLLLRNGLTGFILVFVTLALFIQLRLAFWVSLGIPISFLGALWLLPGFDVSVSMISLFAFIVVLGIVVDDAIIVGENVHTHQQRHHDGLRGAIEGAREIAVPVIFAVLTSVAAFLPLLAVEGVMGKVMRVIPLVVIPCLLFSLIESLLILPAHLSHLRTHVRSRRPGPWARVQNAVPMALRWFIDHVYRPSLEFGIRWRYLTVAVGISTLILTIGLVIGGWVRFEFFPSVESDFISGALTMPQGTAAEKTSEAVRQMELGAERVRQEMEQGTGQQLFRHLYAAIGEQPFAAAQQQNATGRAGGASAGHLGEVTIELSGAETRTVSADELRDRWRDAVGAIPDAVEVNFSSSLFSPGDDVNVQLTGSDLDSLQAAADEIKTRLGELAGVYEVTDSFRRGKREVKLGITPAAEVWGLSLADLARQVRQAFYGEEAQRIQRARDDIRVMVRYPEEERRSIGDLESMRVRTPSGGEVPFSDVAVVEPGRGYASITRVDRRRTVNVTADVDPAVAAAGDIVAELDERILPEVLGRHPGVRHSFEGQQAEQRDTLGGLQRGFTLALIMIYALLAVPLRSYLQPLIIMSAIPFGLVGALWGHVIMGMNLTILSMFGIVALAGVVVNDSLVMVDFINRHRLEHDRLETAVREAGAVRFRPILLTSLTTFAGLSPLLLEKSMQAQFLIPMAVSLAFGVMFSTFITLMLVPSGYMILEDIKWALSSIWRALARLYGRQEPSGALVDVRSPDSAPAPGLAPGRHAPDAGLGGLLRGSSASARRR